MLGKLRPYDRRLATVYSYLVVFAHLFHSIFVDMIREALTAVPIQCFAFALFK
jgi:hypothetical protein